MNAFPSPRDPKTGSDDKGMSLRDYFAAKAMQSLIIRDGEHVDFLEVITATAYQYADDMLRERDLWLLKTSLYM